jgi:hypothetical protein
MASTRTALTGRRRGPDGTPHLAAGFVSQDHILKSAVEPQHPSAKRERLNICSRWDALSKGVGLGFLCELSQP